MTCRNFVKMFDAGKKWNDWVWCKNYDSMLNRFHPIPGRYGQTDRIALSISRVSVLTRDKNCRFFIAESPPGERS